MAEKQFKYTAKIKQPQSVGAVKIDPKGGAITEREYRAIKKDPYGSTLLEKGLLVVDTSTTEQPAPVPGSGGEGSGDSIPDFDDKGTGANIDRPEDHAGWKPE